MVWNYLAHTDQERQEMLERIGLSSIEQIFSVIPPNLQDFVMNLPQEGLSELELSRFMTALSEKNTPVSRQISFLGGGAYHHFMPAALDLLISRSEFLTAYTPYQAEISQGTLQTIYEFQSMVCELTGMDVANASLYEGATATAEAVLMAARLTGRQQVLLSPALHPDYQTVLDTYTHAAGLSLSQVPSQAGATSPNGWQGTQEPAALVVQYPNFFGIVEELPRLADWIHQRGGLLIAVVTDLTVLGLLESPGILGADIVVGEAQACGNSLSFGGPYVGFLAARSADVRQIPGRISGLAQDEAGKRAFTLILQTREQHIRRERATSNVCTNQGLNALIVTIWLTLLGKQGLHDLAYLCLSRAHACADRISQVPGFSLSFRHPFFHEFVVETTHDPEALFAFMLGQQCLPGLALKRWYPELSHHFLVTVTEMNTVDDIERFVSLLQQFASHGP